MMPVAILAGGLGTRLRPATEERPKALLDIGAEPFVFHQLRLLRARGIGRVVLCIGYHGDQIVRAVGDGRQFGIDVSYSSDGPVPLGTGGALLRALPQLGDAFFVLYGDSYLECDYRAVQSSFAASGTLGLMTVYRNQDRWQPSNVELAGGRIVAHDKRLRTPRMRHMDYGLGALRRAAFASVTTDRFDLELLYRELLGKGQLAAHEVHRRHYEAGSAAGIEELRRHLGGANPRGAPP